MKKRRDKKRSESGASADGRGERTTRISGFCVEGLGRNVRVGGRGKAGGDKGKVGMNRQRTASSVFEVGPPCVTVLYLPRLTSSP